MHMCEKTLLAVSKLILRIKKEFHAPAASSLGSTALIRNFVLKEFKIV